MHKSISNRYSLSSFIGMIINSGFILNLKINIVLTVRMMIMTTMLPYVSGAIFSF